MKTNEICEKFEECKLTQTYKRIDATHPIDIYLGCNEDNKKSLIIVVDKDPGQIESTKMILVDVAKRMDERINIAFTLLDNGMSEIYYHFCNDIIEKTRSIERISIVPYIIERWKMWIKMFKEQRNMLMSENEVRGFLGELIFLKEYMFKHYGISNSLNAWEGSSFAHKDFSIENTWYEIKTIRENGLLVEISSIEQLQSDVYGELVIVKLEPSNVSVSGSITLNSYIKHIIDSLESEEQKILFQSKLDERKYICLEDYDQYIYVIKSQERYGVEDDFPRIISSDLKDGIARINYSIYMESIKKYKVGE